VSDNKGEIVFENVDELLTDKIIDHTRSHTDLKNKADFKGFTDIADSTQADTFSEKSKSDNSTKPSNLRIIITMISVTVFLFIIKAFFLNCRKKFR
jgi:hypothetical protein